MNDLQLIMLVGIPASGKSTYCQKFAQQGYVVLSSDAIRLEIKEQLDSGKIVMPSNTNLNSMVFDNVFLKAKELLSSGKSVVVDATNLGRKRRMNFIKHLYKVQFRKICYLFITSPEVCLERNSKRAGYARVPDESMYNMFCSFQCPNYWDGFDEIVPIIDDVPYNFDYESTMTFSQDNPHHTLTLGEHMQAAYKYAVENEFSPEVVKAAYYHDIGKLPTKRYFNMKGEPTKEAHFYSHENYGAYMFLAQNCCGKSLTKEQFENVLYLTSLINEHMRPLNVWRYSDNAKKKDKILFGEKFFNDIVCLNKADRFAH